MDEKNYAKQDRKNLIIGSIHLTVFAILILAGIYFKRVLGMPEYMMAFHGPAAVFLIVGGFKITEKQRRRFKEVKMD
ncbi:MAG: hypothetical protein WCY48_09200 [Candidatus Caldatribacteriota bacterium]